MRPICCLPFPKHNVYYMQIVYVASFYQIMKWLLVMYIIDEMQRPCMMSTYRKQVLIVFLFQWFSYGLSNCFKIITGHSVILCYFSSISPCKFKAFLSYLKWCNGMRTSEITVESEQKVKWDLVFSSSILIFY